MRRLNRRQRIGVILSVIWLIGGGALVHLIARAAGGGITVDERLLSESDLAAVNAGDLTKVSPEGLLVVHNEIDRVVKTRTVVWTLTPLIMTWGLVYLVGGLVRWVSSRWPSPRRR